ncbi:MAG: FG-GAP-like repeat-containing protein [Verrucomicrobiota bacterium]
MKTKLKLISICHLLSAICLSTHAQGTAFTYQGRLADGANPANGSYDLRFGVFNDDNGGVPMGGWLTNSATAVTNGLFTVTLDFGNQFPGSPRWLEIAMRTNGGGVFAMLAPRQRLTATPYAVFAGSAGTSANAITVAGLTMNTNLSSVALGAGNTASAAFATVSGGTANNASATHATVSGGLQNTATGQQATVGGGYLNKASGERSVVAGGYGNEASGYTAFLGAGLGNRVSGNYATLGGGDNNLASGGGAFVGGGSANQATNGFATVPGGEKNLAGGLYSFAAGRRAKALHEGAFVWADHQAADFASTTDDQFLIRALGGVGINTNNPNGAALAVNGNVIVTGTVSGTFSGNGAGVTGVPLGSVNSAGAFTWPGIFVVASSPGVGSEPRSVTAVDVNGDGKADLISANTFDNTLTVLTNNGSGGFVLASSLSVGSQPQSVTSAEVNGDGKADLIAGGIGGLAVLTNDGSGGFALSSSRGGGSLCVTSADVNGDGRPDLISANAGPDTLTVLTNNGSGGFVLSASPGVGSVPYSVTSADVNGDGKPDLISANRGANTLTVLTNIGSGGFVFASSPGVGSEPFSVTAADVNGDGRVDLVSANSGTNTLTVLTNSGGAGFALGSSPVVGYFPQSVASADVNGDGKADLISGNLGTMTVLTNNGSGGFALGSSLVVGSILSSVTAADVNGDGMVDLIGANYGFSELTVWITKGTFSGIFAGNGSGLTALNAGSLTGTIADARLSANVALLNSSQTFGGANNFNANVEINPPASLSFGSQTRQMINLWSTEYGLGVQGGAGYFRSGGDFFWYRGGSHTDANGDAGGGVPLMSLKSSGNLGLGTTTPAYPLEVQNGLAVGRFTTTNNGNGAVLILKNTATSTTFLGAINFDDATSTPGQIGYLASGQMTFRVAGADRMNLQAGGLFVNGAVVLTSDRNAKADFAAVDAQEVLEKVAALPLQSWSYTNRPGVKHVGPMAQDFRAAFGLGEDDKHIATVDADGVALAAIQGLNQKLDETRAENAALKTWNESLERRVERLEKLLSQSVR